MGVCGHLKYGPILLLCLLLYSEQPPDLVCNLETATKRRPVKEPNRKAQQSCCWCDKDGECGCNPHRGACCSLAAPNQICQRGQGKGSAPAQDGHEWCGDRVATPERPEGARLWMGLLPEEHAHVCRVERRRGNIDTKDTP